MSKLGLIPAPMSGAGWIVKEDGENEVAMVQLKSTDASSYKLSLFDVSQLEYHAATANKVPIFLIQFLQKNRIYAFVDLANIEDVVDALKLGKAPGRITLDEEHSDGKPSASVKIKSSAKARNEFFEERREKFGEGKQRNKSRGLL